MQPDMFAVIALILLAVTAVLVLWWLMRARR